ncbi:SGNH/GDSL hydrolase family protein [Candidatus Gottesmanbacteria bacterium]|nr:SGNH/GDSL hydrolase family protein [Candidatus Gottesmanbacteria bacterium]
MHLFSTKLTTFIIFTTLIFPLFVFAEETFTPNEPLITFGRLIKNENIKHFPSKEEIENNPNPQVLGITTALPTPEPISSSPSPVPPISPNSPTIKSYTIAVLGDSMVETLGQEMWHLKTALHQYYPYAHFNLLNYGDPATDAEFGLHRLTNDFDQMGTRYPSLLSRRPDIVVVESFAYNPWGDGQNDIDRHWLTIAKMIDAIKTASPQTKIILAATIAPNANVFGDGVLNWDAAGKLTKTNTIKKYLQNIINFAGSEHYPLADSYHASLGSDGNGLLQYMSGDHLHPSGPGGMLFSQKIADAIWENHLID